VLAGTSFCPGLTWIDRIAVPAWVTGPDRTLLHLNESAENLLGCRDEACTGRACYDVLGGSKPLVFDPETQQPFCKPRCSVHEALERGRELSAAMVCIVPAPNTRGWVHLLPIPVRNEAGDTFLLHCGLPADREHRIEAYLSLLARRSPHPAGPLPCSGRELEVLRLLADDLTLGEIADRLGVSYATVRNHIQHMLAKLHAHSTAEAIAVYLLEHSPDQKSTINPRRCVSPRASGSKR
jgi:DNA-binding CsgD family transcriptional regulator